MLKIWGRATSSNVQKVMWAIGELGVPHERIDAGGVHGGLETPAFAAMNPMRLVPVLEDDGFPIWESQAIVRYLATNYGRGTLAPADPKHFARADQWMDWNWTAVQPDIITSLFWGLIRTPKADRNETALAASAKRVGERLAVLDAHLATRAYIMGDQLTMADIPVGTNMYRYFTMPIERPSLPHVEAWYARLCDRPAYAKHAMVDYSVLKVPGA